MPRIDIHEVAGWLAGTGPGTTVFPDSRTGECLPITGGYEDLGELGEELDLEADHGRGAFRVFKDTAHELGLIDRWYARLHDETVGLLRPLLEDAGIAYHERGRRPDGTGTGA